MAGYVILTLSMTKTKQLVLIMFLS